MELDLLTSIYIILSIFAGALGALILYTGRNMVIGVISLLICSTVILIALTIWIGALITIAIICAVGAYFFLDSQGYI